MEKQSNEAPQFLAEEAQEQTSQGRSSVPVLFAVFALISVAMAGIVLFTSRDASQLQPPGTRAAQIARGSIIGFEVPPFSLETLEGETVSISDYRGQVVFLNFWATWCVPCQREMPAFETFMAAGREDAVVLAVNNGEATSDVASFATTFGLEHLPILLDPEFKVADGLGIVNLPVTYVIDEQGIVQNFKLGEITLEEMEAYIAEIRS
jgi:peroxiredoxin